jgi:hypothetical protein
MLPTKWQ